MTYVASIHERERKLRLARSAAASAVYNGCDPDEVRRVVEEGIAEVTAEQAAHASRWSGPGRAERPSVSDDDATSALAAFEQAAGL